jgi:hypothetical protein
MWEHQISCSLTFAFMFQVWILYHLESPFHTHPIEFKDVFNWTSTYRRDSDIPAPYSRWVYYDERVKQNARPHHNYAANKTKKVSCSITEWVEPYLYSPSWALRACYRVTFTFTCTSSQCFSLSPGYKSLTCNHISFWSLVKHYNKQKFQHYEP